MWPDLKLLHGKPRHNQSQGSVEKENRDIQDMLVTWMQTNNVSRWSESLRLIQLMKNRAFHSGIKRSPYEAMFGTKVKIGLSDFILPAEHINQLTTEEDLENVLDTKKNGNDESPDRQIDDGDVGAVISSDIESVSVVTENNFTSKICDSTDISIDRNCTTHTTMENEEVETNILLRS
ncbi:hypothetical protein NQ314_012825 [Rhamnusium bicolor]|uniref:Integrase catalytic domain-containing protein n=1 Tax=Rhamnusium bicolor TaxID=1586634 RepID=A0AAV8XAC9_9CUCU|nr:hypothetical protein NQ314_012825 [Rhamnusium bicolor]